MNANNEYELTRSVSKTGELGLVSEETLSWARKLTDTEKVALYCEIRDESQRTEPEWRDEFVRLVQIQPEALPEVECDDVNLEDFIRWAKDHSDRGEVVDTFEELLEQTPVTAMQQARQFIVETGQDDLLEIFDEYSDSDAGE